MNRSHEERQRELYLAYQGPYQGKKTAETLLSLVRRHVREPILDVGAGDGSLLLRLRGRGCREVEGIDLAPAADFIREGTMTALPYADSTFRTVFCTEVVEHMEPEGAAAGLREIFRVLRPGGRLIVTVPDREIFARNQVVCPNCHEEFHRYGHHQVFDEESFSRLLAACGFRIRSLKPYALGAMAVVPFGRLFNPVFRRLQFESVAVTLVAVAEKGGEF